MAKDRNAPNRAANESKAEGDRWGSESDTVERTSREAHPETSSDEGAGITNRPLEEESENQDRVPDRGQSREGAHAGHGNASRSPKEGR